MTDVVEAEPPPRPRRELDLSGLNPAQYEAVTLPPGPILVVAGAGSGKTRVLTHRLAYLVSEIGASPFEVLAITFTNKAAGEMRERVAELVGPVGRRMWVSTFHAACSGSCAARRRCWATGRASRSTTRPTRSDSPIGCAEISTWTRSASPHGSSTRRSAR